MNAFLSKFDDVEKIEEDEDKKKEEETDKWPIVRLCRFLTHFGTNRGCNKENYYNQSQC